VVFFDAGAQLAFRDVLEVLIDRQLEVTTGRGRPFDPAGDGMTARVGLDQDAAGPAADLVVVRRLDSV
jgi:hypothetical protein